MKTSRLILFGLAAVLLVWIWFKFVQDQPAKPIGTVNNESTVQNEALLNNKINSQKK